MAVVSAAVAVVSAAVAAVIAKEYGTQRRR